MGAIRSDVAFVFLEGLDVAGGQTTDVFQTLRQVIRMGDVLEGQAQKLGFRSASNRLILERLSFFGAMIEVAQSIPALHRDCDPLDWVADSVAVSVALALCLAVQRMRPARAVAHG